MKLFKQKRFYHQQGAALLLIAAAMIVAASAFSYALLGGLGQKLKMQTAQQASQALSAAKQNLLTFSSMQPELYPNALLNNVPGIGYMPPADFDNDGRMGTFAPASYWYNTTNLNVIGRLPALHKDVNPFYFYTRSCPALGIACDNDGSQSSLWVAMSGRNGAGNLRLQQRIEPLNSSTLQTQLDITVTTDAIGNITSVTPNSAATCATQGIVCLDGTPVVAILIDAGSPLQNQGNRVTMPLDYTQYLDMANADANLYNFISRFPAGQVCANSINDTSACFNDQVIAITYSDWHKIMVSRVKSEFSDVSTTLCDPTWRAQGTNSFHWAVRNRWYTITSANFGSQYSVCP